MNIQIENLKAYTSGRNLNVFQKADAIDEFNKLLNYVDDLEKQLKLCEVGVTFKDKQDTTFSIWLMANEYKQIGSSYVFKKGDKRFDLEQLRQIYNDYLIQP